MRVIAEIPHPEIKITIFYMNQKYLVKFEKNILEQTYKISEFDYLVTSVEDIKIIINEGFIQQVKEIFTLMNSNLALALKDY